jgi:cyclomaltodextrinase / maltogenic alpha-amylase / neopullulanase
VNRHAIYHITDVPYAYGKDLDTLSIVLRTAKNDIKKCELYYKDRYDWENDFNVVEMYIKNKTDLFDYYHVDISVDRNRYRYYFKLTDLYGNSFYLDERGIRNNEIDRKEATAFQYPYIAKGDLYDEVKWLQESVVYQIFVDRFCNGDSSNNPPNVLEWGEDVTRTSMFGGDLKGIINKLDYLMELGIDLIYLTPIFKSSSNHKYNIGDYFVIDPQFGDIEDAKELVKQCHKRNMKIVLDAVFNHSGDDFFAFEDIVKNGDSSLYKDWYLVDSYPIDKKKVNYYTFANNVYTMPKFNISNKEVTQYLLNVAKFWIDEVGVDGWRLDVCDEVDHDFWRAFKKTVKEANHNAIIVGEIMHEATSFLKGDQLDSIMNYPFKGALIDFFAKRSISVQQFSEILAQNRVIYIESITRQLWNLFGSHDTQRFLTECNNDIKRMQLAIAFQFCYLGVPYIYYGDEIGLDGGEEPLSRKCMIWDKEKQKRELFDLYKRLIKIRKENSELIYGEYNEIYCNNNVIVFERFNNNNNKVIVAINNNEIEVEVELNLYKNFKELLNNNNREIEKNLVLAPMEFKILKMIK